MQRPRHVSIDDLVAHWLPCGLEVGCGCSPPRLVPLVPIANRGGGRQSLGAVIARLRCGRCQLRPVSVALREAIVRRGAKGPEWGWSFPLPAPSPAPPSGKYNRLGHRVAAGVEYWQIQEEAGGPPRTGLEDFPSIW